jgi:uncharacterized protein (TIGR02594 family)
MLKVKLTAVILATALLAPELALAYGRATPTPNIFAANFSAAPRETGPTFPARREARPTFAARRQTGRAVAARRGSGSTFGARLETGSTFAASGESGSRGDVVAEAARWIGAGKFTGQPGPWCADAVSAWLERSGHRPLAGRMASSALAYGPRLERPEVGALAVLGSRRGWASHVGVVAGVDPDGSVRLISGNWGRRVAEAVISRGSVIAFVAVR